MCDHHLIVASAALGVVVALQTPLMCLGYTQRIHIRRDWSRQRHHYLELFPNSPYTNPSHRTLVRLQSRNPNQQDFDFKEFDIDDILSEAEIALKAAEESLENVKPHAASTISSKRTTKTTMTRSSNKQQSTPPSRNITGSQSFPSPPSQTISMDVETITDMIASTMGGILLGSIFGSIAAFQFPEVLSALKIEDNVSLSPLLVLPVLGGLMLGTVGLIGALQSNIMGTVTKKLLGVPMLALVSAILSAIQSLIVSLQLDAQRQAEKIADDIRALPQNIANSAQQTVKSSVASAVEEITSLPRKAREKVVQSSVQVVDNVKSSVESAVEEVASIPRKARDKVVKSTTQAVETVKSFPRNAEDNVAESGIWSNNFLLPLVVIPSMIVLGFLTLDALFAGRVQLPSM